MFQVEQASPRVRILWMDDGKVNAIGPAFLQGFPEAWSEATAHGGAVVLASRARAFCAGLDLRHVGSLDEAGMVAFAQDLVAVFSHVQGHLRPVVAAVEGAAIAGGAAIALCADQRVVTTRTRMGMSEVPVGVPFPEPVARLVMHRLPPQEHAPALLEGVLREGAAIVERGWAQRLVDEGRAVEEAVGLAEALASHSRLAFDGAKRLMDERLTWAFDAKAWAAEALSQETMEAVGRTLERLAKR